jgi:TonB family protein
MLSLAAHAVLLGLLLLWRLPLEPEPPARRVLLEFRRPGDSRVPPPSGRSPAVQPPSSYAASSRRAMPGLPVQEGARLAMPPAAVAPAGPAPLAPQIPRLQGPQAQVPEATGAAALPTPAQALGALGGKEREQAASPQQAAPREEPLIGDIAPQTAGYMPPAALEWKTGGRSLLLQPRLRFPELLLEKGLEVDVEAAFIVAPSGQVTSVVITRSSGFASVDREVEQALRDALFAESSQQDSGRIQFRFRLERAQ